MCAAIHVWTAKPSVPFRYAHLSSCLSFVEIACEFLAHFFFFLNPQVRFFRQPHQVLFFKKTNRAIPPGPPKNRQFTKPPAPNPETGQKPALSEIHFFEIREPASQQNTPKVVAPHSLLSCRFLCGVSEKKKKKKNTPPTKKNIKN